MPQMERVLKALANKRRLKMIRALVKRRVLHVSALADEVEVPLKTVSRNLRLMELAGLVTSEPRAGRVYYSVSAALWRFAGRLIAAILAEPE